MSCCHMYSFESKWCYLYFVTAELCTYQRFGSFSNGQIHIGQSVIYQLLCKRLAFKKRSCTWQCLSEQLITVPCEVLAMGPLHVHTTRKGVYEYNENRYRKGQQACATCIAQNRFNTFLRCDNGLLCTPLIVVVAERQDNALIATCDM